MTIKTDETVNAPGLREALPIKPTAVALNRASHCNREWFVHLDDTTTLQDATSSKPELWRLVQKNRDKAFSEGDEVRLIWPDQIAVAIVDYADGEQVVFLRPNIFSRRQRDRVAWQDANFEVRSIQGAWTYFRKKDGQRMTAASWATPDGAKAACIREQAPARM
jgi:hypothetical protein